MPNFLNCYQKDKFQEFRNAYQLCVIDSNGLVEGDEKKWTFPILYNVLRNEFIIQIQESYKASKNNLVHWNFNLNEEIGMINDYCKFLINQFENCRNYEYFKINIDKQ